MKKNIKNYLLGGLIVSPLFTFAAVDTLGGLISLVKSLLTSVLPLIMTLAVIYFVWALTKFISKAGEKKEAAKEQMVWGIIILFVMVSFWGLVNILTNTIF